MDGGYPGSASDMIVAMAYAERKAGVPGTNAPGLRGTEGGGAVVP